MRLCVQQMTPPLTLEFDDHFVIQPTIQTSDDFDFSTNNIGEKGSLVERGY